MVGIVVTKVLRTGSGSKAGLLVEDELIAAGGVRLPKDNWKERITGLDLNGSIEFLISRRGKIKTLSIRTALKRQLPLTISSTQSPQQAERRRRWLSGHFLRTS